MLNNRANPSNGAEYVYSDRELITPESAAEYLKKNVYNRRLDQATVKYYQDMMLNNRWYLNGESIKFSTDGTLLDGQHRLEAVIKSGKAIETFVIRNLDKKTFVTIDAGKSRKPPDFLKAMGKIGNLAKLSSAARISMNFSENGEYIEKKSKVPPESLLDFIEKNKPLEFIVEQTNSKAIDICPKSIAIAMRYIFSLVDKNAADDFFDKLISGADLHVGSPILVLRTRLTNLKVRHGQSSRREIVSCFVSAFNSFREGRGIKSLKYKPESKISLNDYRYVH